MGTVFYVKNRAGVLVQATFLVVNGSSVRDNNTANAQNTPIYDQNGNLQQNANPNGFS
jgi:hypothetical protein